MSDWERAVCSGKILWGLENSKGEGKVSVGFLSYGVERGVLELAVRGWGKNCRGALFLGRSCLEGPHDFFSEYIGLWIYRIRYGV